MSIKNTKSFIQDLINTLTNEDWLHLKRYNLHHLKFFLNLKLDYNFLHGALTFWDPTLHVFRFREMEPCPTMEEFSAILGIKISPQQEMASLDPDLVVVHAMNHLFGIGKSEVNGCIVSSSLISFCGLIHYLQSNPGSYNPILIIRSIILGYYLLEYDKSILGLMVGKVLSILSQIDVEMNLTPKLVALVVLVETLNGLDKVKVNRNA